MSRIGKMPVPVPSGVTINIDGSNVSVKGPKGELSRKFPEGISFTIEDNKVITTRSNDESQQRALHGLSRALMANMVEGADKEVVGQVAAEIRSLRKPEPYKGKGIKYVGEKIRRKAGKAGGK